MRPGSSGSVAARASDRIGAAMPRAIQKARPRPSIRNAMPRRTVIISDCQSGAVNSFSGSPMPTLQPDGSERLKAVSAGTPSWVCVTTTPSFRAIRCG